MRHVFKFLLTCAIAMFLTAIGVGYYEARADSSQLLDARYPGQWLDPLVEYRYIGSPRRDGNGRIIRRLDVLAAFQAQHPCPSTGLRAGKCPDWYIDHVIPLACGGIDAVSNLQWLHKSIKSTAYQRGFFPKDRVERLIYGQEPPIPGTGSCTYATPDRTLK